ESSARPRSTRAVCTARRLPSEPAPMGAPVARRTVVGSLAHGVRSALADRRAAHSCGSASVSHRLPPSAPSRSGPRTASGLHATAVGCDCREMSSSAQTRVGAARPYHAVTWFVWALAGTTAVQLASSPVYVVLVIGIAWLVVGAYGLPGPFARAFPILLTLGVVFAVLRVVLMALTTHGGLDVLFTTPSFTMPDFLGGFTVGGSIELPVVLQAGNEGLVIIGVIAVFGAFNAVASHFELVQALPRAFYEVGLVVIVALAFVPSTIGAVSDVREADRARTGGRVVRRGRLLRQLVPVLESGLERAVTLAESMDSRGFAHGGASRS